MSIAIEYLYKYIKKFDVNLLAGESGLNNKVRWTHIVESEEPTLLKMKKSRVLSKQRNFYLQQE